MTVLNKWSIFFTFFVILASISSFADDAGLVDPQALAFFKQAEGFELAEKNMLINQSGIFQSMYAATNNDTQTLQTKITIECADISKCPKESLQFDTVFNDTILPGYKKVYGIYIVANDTPLGNYSYIFTIRNAQNEKILFQKHFFIETYSLQFWPNFWFNLRQLFFLT